MQEFLNAEYFLAVRDAVLYGLCVFGGFVLLNSVIVAITGGPAAKNWGEAH
ncbi:MAG: hypothetical protein HY319_12810 [Armatimonadetes bacterium]|nr:hypothetical protein [Armatimonadota bacterium]